MRFLPAMLPLALLMLPAGLVSPAPLRAENYAFLVAVQDYDAKDLKKLNYTRSDIEEFGKVLQKSGFKRENVVVMSDKPDKARYMAESGKIRTELRLVLGAVESKDTLIVAFSGHGVQFEGEEKNYYCPLDADLEDPKRATLIPMSELYDKLKQCPAEKKLLLVDACRNDPLSPVKKSRQTVRLNSVTRPQTEPVPKGVVALFSCAAGQESYEWPDLKHGVFFYHVLEGWNGAAAGADKHVTLDGVVTYAKQKTQTFARLNLRALQTPQVKSDFEGIWVLRTLTTPDLGGRSKLRDLPAEGTSSDVPSGSAKEVANSIGMKLVLIPKGEFLMGSPDSDKDALSSEKPRHRVEITKAFYLGKHEVTRGEFRKFVADSNYKTDAEKDGKGAYGYTGDEKSPYAQKPEFTWRNAGFTQTDEHPVVNVSWNDAVEFCKWLSRKEEKTYRLPTEAEWEYACRADTTTRWSGGDDEGVLQRIANIADSSLKSRNSYFSWSKSWDDGYPFTAPVGKLRANNFGLRDMHGNVWEWCSDWFDEKYYANSGTNDPQGPDSGKGRVLRGGSWNGNPGVSRAALRGWSPPDVRSYGVGFRVVRAGSARTR